MKTDVAYVKPDTLMEALEFLGEYGKETKIIAGGTDIMVGFRSEMMRPSYLMDISGLAELKGVSEKDGELFIGSGVAISDILSSDLVARVAPVLQKASSNFASRQIRNMATIGGNICRASPAGDTLPALYALDAKVELVSSASSRRVPLSQFVLGPGETDLEAGEVLQGLWIKKTHGFHVNRFEKVGNRRMMAVTVVSLASLLRLNDTGVIESARLAWGSVAATVVRATRVEQFLVGKSLNAETLEKAFPLVQKQISPIDDIRASASYRRSAATGLLFRLLDNPKKLPENMV